MRLFGKYRYIKKGKIRTKYYIIRKRIPEHSRKILVFGPLGYGKNSLIEDAICRGENVLYISLLPFDMEYDLLRAGVRASVYKEYTDVKADFSGKAAYDFGLVPRERQESVFFNEVVPYLTFSGITGRTDVTVILDNLVFATRDKVFLDEMTKEWKCRVIMNLTCAKLSHVDDLPYYFARMKWKLVPVFTLLLFKPKEVSGIGASGTGMTRAFIRPELSTGEKEASLDEYVNVIHNMCHIGKLYNGSFYTGTYIIEKKRLPYVTVYGKNKTSDTEAVIVLDEDNNIVFAEDLYLTLDNVSGDFFDFSDKVPEEGQIVRAKCRNKYVIGKYVSFYLSKEHRTQVERTNVGPGIVFHCGALIESRYLSSWQPVEAEIEREYKEWFEQHPAYLDEFDMENLEG